MSTPTRPSQFPAATNPWDRAAAGYLTEWVPRFVPYHRNLISELALAESQKVLVVGAGPGSEALIAARQVGPRGRVRATDASGQMVALCSDQAKRAGLDAVIETAEGDVADTAGGPWDAIVSAFGLWQIADDDRVAVVRGWGEALAPGGKVGVLTWGPTDATGPFELLSASLREIVPSFRQTNRQRLAAREPMEQLFKDAGLSMVRLTVIAHPHHFSTAEQFVASLRDACTWRSVWDELGTETLNRVAASFYGKVGGPEAPLNFDPAATLAIAARPGEEVVLSTRTTVG
jgi:ubiquinone/menaquinone biosynthesis C-methylase UbiE